MQDKRRDSPLPGQKAPRTRRRRERSPDWKTPRTSEDKETQRTLPGLENAEDERGQEDTKNHEKKQIHREDAKSAKKRGKALDADIRCG